MRKNKSDGPVAGAVEGSASPADVCPCRIINVGGAGQTLNIKFCPLHDAAPVLLAALRLMVSPVEHLDGCLWRSDKRMPCQCGYNDRINSALEQAHAAIAKAEPTGLSNSPTPTETSTSPKKRKP